MTVAQPRVSFADLEQWPEDGRRYELYDGEVYVVPSPLPLHQVVSANLHLALTEYVREHGGVVLYAPLDIVLTEYDVVQPDLLLFTRQRQDLIDLRKVTRHQPDLAIEILSPSTVWNDLSCDQFLIASAATGTEAVHSPLLPGLKLRPIDVVPNPAA